MTPERIRFLSTEDVLRIHLYAMLDQGGEQVLRDSGLLESALAMPRQQFGGAYLHPDVPSMAAAYAFHISGNHPFTDGNKRAATAAMIQFLADNGWTFEASADEAEPVILRLAAGQVDKETLTEWVRLHTRQKARLDLREFFGAVHWSMFDAAYRALAQNTDGFRASEFGASFIEATKAMPCLGQLGPVLDAAQQLAAAGDVRAEIEVKAIARTLVAMHRLAEDMGYEW